jgi:predicted permease
MNFLRRYFRRLLNFALRRRTDERLREEIAWHLEVLTEENIQSGMIPEEARRRAFLQFGAVEAVRERYRDEESIPFLENCLLDLRYAVRVLLKSPAFSLVALLTLTLGIAVNVFVFGILNAVILTPLEVNSPHTLYQLRDEAPVSGHLLTTSYPAFVDFRNRNTTFSDLAAIYGYSSADLDAHGGKTRVYGDEVTGNYFDLLGVYAGVGRFFHKSDIRREQKAPYVVLSDALWRKSFHSNTRVIGTTIFLNQCPFTVIGVASPRFHGTERFVWPDYWIPMSSEQELESGWDYLHSRTYTAVTVIGRLRPGFTPAQAATNLTAIAAELAKENPTTDKSVSLRLVRPGLYGDEGGVIRGFLYAVAILVLLVLSAVCANLASLSLARFADRRRELAVRVALGAGRFRLIRQLLLESLLLAVIGGALGLVLGISLLQLVNEWSLPLGHLAVSLDWRIYAAATFLTVGSVVLFGFLPAWHVARQNPSQMMKGIPICSYSVRRFFSSDLLLSLQIAICTLLIMASLVAIRGMVRALHVHLGFQPHDALLVNVDMGRLSGRGDGDGGAIERVLDVLSRIPSVSKAGAVNRLPMTGGLHGTPVFRKHPRSLNVNDAASFPYVFEASPGYLDAAGTRLLMGRDITWKDDSTAPDVAIVNETFARNMWPNQSALGETFIVSGRLTLVIGVAQNGKYHDMEETPQPVVYLPLLQAGDGNPVFVVRSPRRPNVITADLEQALDGPRLQVPITIRRWDDTLETELFPSQVAMVALGILGLLAVMLAVTGIFGTATYNVSRRMKEFGVYVALGARKMTVVAAAVGRPMLVLLTGSLAGVATGILAERFWGHLVYEAQPGDPTVIAGTLLAMFVLGVAASLLPAHRAISVNPARLMRRE